MWKPPTGYLTSPKVKVKPKKYVIAIDGPAGSGKSTTAKILAQKLRFFYLDTGAMYRALTWKAIQQNLDVANPQQMKKQRAFAKNRNLVIEGRDTTTVVFPKADLKIFLKADLNTRAVRKYRQLKRKTRTTLKEQAQLIRLRDKLDQSRKASPLKISPDAVIIDTTNLTISEQVDRILSIFKQKFPA